MVALHVYFILNSKNFLTLEFLSKIRSQYLIVYIRNDNIRQQKKKRAGQEHYGEKGKKNAKIEENGYWSNLFIFYLWMLFLKGLSFHLPNVYFLYLAVNIALEQHIFLALTHWRTNKDTYNISSSSLMYFDGQTHLNVSLKLVK